MTSTILKFEVEGDCCVLCGSTNELQLPEEYDALAPAHQTSLRSMLLHLNNNKVIPDGKYCSECSRRTVESFEFSSALSARTAPPLSEKIRALRRRLHELTQKIDVFIVVGGEGGGGSYSEDDIIMVDRKALAAATAHDNDELEKAKNARGESVFQCTVCPLTFQTLPTLRAHEQTHPADAPHCCWTCGAQGPSAQALRLHLAQAPGCRLCDGPLPAPAEARRHEAACAWRCPACQEACGSRAALRAHVERPGGDCGARVCPRCWAPRGDSAEARAAHRLHCQPARSFLCGFHGCILRFATRANLLAHIRKCHGAPPAAAAAPAAQPLACPSCPRTFASAGALKRHARTHRSPSPSPSPEPEVRAGEQPADRSGGEGPSDGELEYLEVEALEEEFME